MPSNVLSVIALVGVGLLALALAFAETAKKAQERKMNDVHVFIETMVDNAILRERIAALEALLLERQ